MKVLLTGVIRSSQSMKALLAGRKRPELAFNLLDLLGCVCPSGVERVCV